MTNPSGSIPPTVGGGREDDSKPEWWSSDHWSTPVGVMMALEAEFGKFDLDPCCRPETSKGLSFYTEADNGLVQPWTGKVFLNPPYSYPRPWLTKAIEEIQNGNSRLVVCLLPVRTDTQWFHRLVNGKAELRFIEGRIKWIGWKGTPIPNPKDPSMLAIYRAEGSQRQFPKFWTRKNGVDFEAERDYRRRVGEVRICGKCRRGVIAHGTSILRGQCLVCHGEVRKVAL